MFGMFFGIEDVIKEVSEVITKLSLNKEIYEDWVRDHLKHPLREYIELQVREYKAQIIHAQYFIKNLIKHGYKSVTVGGKADG